MPDYTVFDAAIAFVRRSGVTPTPARIAVAKLILDQHDADSLDLLADQAAEDGFGLSRETVAETLLTFERAGSWSRRRPVWSDR